MNVKLKPFSTPNFVIPQIHAPDEDGSTQGPAVPLRQIEADELSEMCDTFRAEIFRKAGKSDPRAPQGQEAP